MRRCFTPHDLAVLRICRRNGWTLSQWEALEDWERTEWMAYDLWLADQVGEVSRRMAATDHYTPEVHAMLILSRL